MTLLFEFWFQNKIHNFRCTIRKKSEKLVLLFIVCGFMHICYVLIIFIFLFNFGRDETMGCGPIRSGGFFQRNKVFEFFVRLKNYKRENF